MKYLIPIATFAVNFIVLYIVYLWVGFEIAVLIGLAINALLISKVLDIFD